MAVLSIRVLGRVFTVMDRRGGAHPVNFAGWFGRHVHECGSAFYAIGPCVLYVNEAAQGDYRVEWECGQLAVSF
jgi:hypothetical protein